jgi:hypothetical protein
MMFSVLSSISYTAGSMKVASESVVISQDNDVEYKSSIKDINYQIATLSKDLAALDPEYGKLKRQYSSEITKLTELKLRLLNEKKDVPEIKSSEDNSALVFFMIAKLLGWDLDAFMLVFFILFALMLDIGTIILMPVSKKAAISAPVEKFAQNQEVIKKEYVQKPVIKKEPVKVEELPTNSGQNIIKIPLAEVQKFAETIHNGIDYPVKGYALAAQESGLTERQGRAILDFLKKHNLVDVRGTRTYPVHSKLEFLQKIEDVVRNKESS